MDDTATHPLDPTVFDANLSALGPILPASAEALASARPPDGMVLTRGRDGEPTFSWPDSEGNPCWLGRTSMPGVSGPALVDSFQTGSGNVLLYGFGQGGEVRCLLERMAPHQAVLVVEEAPWAAAAALRLHDFSAALRRRRLLIFSGPDPWEACGAFLQANDGFLVPDRILSWPWFEPATVALVSDHLAAIQSEVAKRRAAASIAPEADGTRADRADRAGGKPGVAILSNVTSADAHRLARQLAHAAGGLGWPHCCCVLDHPACVHPNAVRRAVAATRPRMLVLIDALPESLSVRLPDAPLLILCSHAAPLSEEWLRRVPEGAWLGTRTERQRRGALEAGLTESSVLHLPPAATAAADPPRAGPRGRIAVAADNADVSAAGVGLHLGSHCRLWAEIERIIASRVDTFRDEEADAVLEEAERRLDIRLDSREVRRGIVERIRGALGPVLVRRAYCTALAEAGLEFDLFGTGWEADDRLGRHHRGPWPEVGEEARALGEHGVIVSLETSGRVSTRLLDGIAAGLAGVVRRHPLDETPDGLAAVLDLEAHVLRFGTRGEMVERVEAFVREPNAFTRRGALAAAHLHSAHTWAHRLRSIVEACVRA